MTTNIFFIILIIVTACAGALIVNLILKYFKVLMAMFAAGLVAFMLITGNFSSKIAQSSLMQTSLLPTVNASPKNNKQKNISPKSTIQEVSIKNYKEDGITYHLIPREAYKANIPSDISMVNVDGVVYLKFRAAKQETKAPFLQTSL